MDSLHRRLSYENRLCKLIYTGVRLLAPLNFFYWRHDFVSRL